MTLKDYVLENTDGFEKDFAISNFDQINSDAHHVVKIENRFSYENDDFLTFSNYVFSGKDIPERSDIDKRWIKFIFEITMKVTRRLSLDSLNNPKNAKKSLEQIQKVSDILKQFTNFELSTSTRKNIPEVDVDKTSDQKPKKNGLDIYDLADDPLYENADYYDIHTGNTYLLAQYNRARRFGLPVDGIHVIMADGTHCICRRME